MLRRWIATGLLLIVPLAALPGCKDAQEPAKVPEPIPAKRFPQKHK